MYEKIKPHLEFIGNINDLTFDYKIENIAYFNIK